MKKSKKAEKVVAVYWQMKYSGATLETAKKLADYIKQTLQWLELVKWELTDDVVTLFFALDDGKYIPTGLGYVDMEAQDLGMENKFED